MKDKLTIEDLDVLIEAIDAWTTASRQSSMLAGLILGAMVASAGNKKGADEFYEKMGEGEEEKQKARQEIAAILKAKLIKMRDLMIVNDVKLEVEQ